MHINEIKDLLKGAVVGKEISEIHICFDKDKENIILNRINLKDGTCISLWGKDDGSVCFDIYEQDN